MIWFYLHCVTAIVILIADANGTLEPTVKKWEKKLGIPVPEANYYLANNVPLADQTVVTVPIHAKNDGFTLRIYSNTPFPVSVNSMMWEGYYSPKYYQRR